jgi:hypothetical protein
LAISFSTGCHIRCCELRGRSGGGAATVFVQPAERRENLAGNYRPGGAAPCPTTGSRRPSEGIVLPRGTFSGVVPAGDSCARGRSRPSRRRQCVRARRGPRRSTSPRSSDHIVVTRRGGLRALAAGG